MGKGLFPTSWCNFCFFFQVQDTLQGALDQLPDFNEDEVDTKSGLKKDLNNGHLSEESFSQAKLGGCCESDLALCQLMDNDSSLLGADWDFIQKQTSRPYFLSLGVWDLQIELGRPIDFNWILTNFQFNPIYICLFSSNIWLILTNFWLKMSVIVWNPAKLVKIHPKSQLIDHFELILTDFDYILTFLSKVKMVSIFLIKIRHVWLKFVATM